MFAAIARRPVGRFRDRERGLRKMTDERAQIKTASRRMKSLVDPIGQFLTDGFHLLALFAIGAATVWAGAAAFLAMVQKGQASLEDLLLLFIYLEIGSMVGIYFRTNHMPVRFLLYVGITALTRHMIGFVQEQRNPDLGVLILAGSTLILALAVLIIRFSSNRYPSPDYGEHEHGGIRDD
jgi:protein PsiE